jgi:glycerol-1-phosphate dehydrogenase [NAD(P)+]
MIAAGFGDAFGKYTALADWQLGRLLWNDRYSDTIAARARKSLLRVVGLIEKLDEAWEENIHALTGALVDVGICMLLAGNSRPASGSEHSCSHYWEMKLMREGRPVSFHGVKVGFASTLIARRYEKIRAMDLSEVKERLAATPISDREHEIATIRRVFGPVAPQVIEGQKAFLALTPQDYRDLQERVVRQWRQVQSIAANVPPEAEICRLLVKAGLPTEPEEIHLTPQDVEEALAYGHYLRNPFTVIKLSRLLGLA